MNKTYKKIITLNRISFFLLIFSFLCLSVGPVYADDCTIVKTQFYIRKQPAIVTDWQDGIPYRKYIVETYPCANITFINNSRMEMDLSDLVVTAIFTDKSMKSKKADCGVKNLEPLEEYSCSVCFESNSQIFSLSCSFRPIR